YRDETTLILDFSVVGHTGSSTQKEVRIPFSEIRRISCHVPNWPGLLGWTNAWRKAEIFVKVFDPADFAELPVGRYGSQWGQLQAHRGDGEAAQELANSIHRSPLLGVGSPRPAGRATAPARVHEQLRGPAWGLLLTAGAALAWTLGPAVVASQR